MEILAIVIVTFCVTVAATEVRNELLKLKA